MRINYPLIVLCGGLIIILFLVLATSPRLQLTVANVINSHYFAPDNNNYILEEGVEKVFVNRVVDGDTIVLEDGRTIRYLYVDTPETVKPNSQVECYGPESSEFNTGVVENSSLILTFDKQKTDRYGRLLALAYLEGVDYKDPSRSINASLIRYGYAKSLIISPNNTYEDIFVKLEEQAQKNNIGLWNACDK